MRRNCIPLRYNRFVKKALSPTADSTLLEDASIVVLDFETTDIAPGTGRFPEPIELAGMRLGPGLKVDTGFTFSSLIKPPAHATITPFIHRLTGIAPADVVDAPPLAEVLGTLNERLRATPSILVAHHAPFDASILWRYVQHCPKVATSRFVDSCALARTLVPGLQRYGLDSLCEHYALPIPKNRHRALADVELTIEVMRRLIHAAQARDLRTVGALWDLAGLKTPRFRMTRFQDSLFADEASATQFTQELHEL